MASQSKAVRKSPTIQPMQAALLLLLLMLVIGALFYFMVYAPKDDEIRKIDAQIAQNNSQRVSLLDQKQNLLARQQEADKIRARLKLLQDRLPSSQEELDEFLSDINQRQQNARVYQWRRYEPMPPVADGELERIPIQMEFLASYDAATAFFWELSQMGADDTTGGREQLVNVTQFAISRTDSLPSGLVQVSCVAETYLFRGTQPGADGGDGADNKRRRRK